MNRLLNLLFKNLINKYFIFKVCHELKSQRIAVITVGNSKVFQIAKIIANTLDIPYISINPDANLQESDKKHDSKLFEINLHPPVSKIITAIIDIIHYSKWNFVDVLFQEPSRIDYLIRYAGSKFDDKKLHFQFKLLSKNHSEWSSLLKNVRESGSSHIIIDIESKYINSFLKLVSSIKSN